MSKISSEKLTEKINLILEQSKLFDMHFIFIQFIFKLSKQQLEAN